MWYLSFSLWLISLRIIPFKSVHVVSDGMIPFFFVAEYAHTVPSFSIHLLMETQVVSTSWLQCCCEYRGHVFFQTCVFIFFGYILKTRIAGSCGSSIFSFLKVFPVWAEDLNGKKRLSEGGVLPAWPLSRVTRLLLSDWNFPHQLFWFWGLWARTELYHQVSHITSLLTTDLRMAQCP